MIPPEALPDHDRYSFFLGNSSNPPYSLDLNPIEHVWIHLKRYFQAKYSDIANTPGGLIDLM